MNATLFEKLTIYYSEMPMLRKLWSFEYTASKLAEAAKNKREHHTERLAWWREQKEAVMDEVKASGIEVSESLAMTVNSSNQRMGPQVMVRNDLQRKLTECFEKLKEHQAKIQEYDGWVQVLTANPESRLELHHDDWLFFFGK
jgi:histidinol-phosphate/aromatic aminotransferase/cobyric acid decarboxylase-like protein